MRGEHPLWLTVHALARGISSFQSYSIPRASSNARQIVNTPPRRREEGQTQIKSVGKGELFFQRVAFVDVILPLGETLTHNVAPVARRIDHDIHGARFQSAFQNSLECRIFRTGIVKRQVIYKNDEFARLVAQNREDSRQIRQGRQRHFHDAQPPPARSCSAVP